MVHSEEVNVNGNAVPVIIGVHGASIKKLQEDLNVKLLFLGLNTEQYAHRPLRIIGTPRDVEIAKRRIADISEGRDMEFFVSQSPPPPKASNSYNFSGTGMVSSEFLVPASVAQLVIGRNEENLKSIKFSQNLQRAEAEGTRVLEDGREMRQIVIQGKLENVENAKNVLQQLVDSYAPAQLNPNVIIDDDFNNFWDTDGTEPFYKNGAATTVNGITIEKSNGSYENANDGSLSLLHKYDPNKDILQKATQQEINKFSVRISGLGERHNREMEGASRMHRERIGKTALEFVRNAEHDAQNELCVLRKKIAKTKTELEETRASVNNGRGIYSAEIAELKNQIRLKDLQINNISAENKSYRCTADNLNLKVMNLKSQQQQLSLARNSALCKTCNNEAKDILLMPCLHVTRCATCADALKNCKVCDVKIVSRLKIKKS